MNSAVKSIGTKEFNEAIESSREKPVLIDFWATWCAPCKTLTPILENVAKKIGNNAQILKIDVDAHGELAQKYDIRGVPTLIFFKNGEIQRSLVGMQSQEEIEKTLQELM